MFPTLEGTLARRVLLNYWLDLEIARRMVPEPLEVVTVNGFAVAGICLIRLEQLRPKGLPAASSENMAHRIAIRYPSNGGMKDGVFIWRRDTDSQIVTRLGGVLFPGVHRDAEFRIEEGDDSLRMQVFSTDGGADVAFCARPGVDWKWTLLFPRFTDVCQFFERGDCGFSCTLRQDALEGMQMRALRWEMTPVAVDGLHSAFYENQQQFPRGSVGFDCGVLMRGIPHEWRQLRDIPELVGATADVR